MEKWSGKGQAKELLLDQSQDLHWCHIHVSNPWGVQIVDLHALNWQANLGSDIRMWLTEASKAACD